MVGQGAGTQITVHGDFPLTQTGLLCHAESTMRRLCELKSELSKSTGLVRRRSSNRVGCLEIYTRQIAGILAQRAKDSRPCAFSDGPSFPEFRKCGGHKFGLNYGGKFFIAVCGKLPTSRPLYCDQNQPGLLNTNNLVGRSKEFAEQFCNNGRSQKTCCIPSIGGFRISHRNGVVSDENERHGHHEMRAITKGRRMRNASGAANTQGNQAGAFPALLALASTSQRMLEQGQGRTGSRDSKGIVAAKISGAEPQESAELPLPQVRRAEDI